MLFQRETVSINPSPLAGEGKGEGEVTSKIETQMNAIRGSGQPLPSAERSSMERRYGVDFRDVRVHTDSNAIELNRELNSEAFTHGRDIYFGAGRYNPTTSSGKKLLAHELTHVVQQGSGADMLRIQRTGWGILGGTCCNRSPEGDEWALVLKQARFYKPRLLSLF
ncbi:MAG: eCIS core domain-containing protein [Candidatus Loosdrechtia sp.]|uniref:eCIS core domain-containing protein n=1 Tax=Candidatus Loosdrechtia sp. TaxID=3101272 RepID=UPI00403ADA4D